MRSAKAWSVIGIVILCLIIPHLYLWLSGKISADVFAGVAVAVVAAIHIYFGLLEGTQWNRPAGLQIHGLGQDVADRTRQIGRNMGLYNVILAIALIGTLFLGRLDAYRAEVALLSLIIVAGVFGTLTIGSPKIVIVQSVPACLALAAVLLGRPGTLSEEQAVAEIIKVEKDLLDIKTKAPERKEKTETMLRGQHPKSVGFVVADFIVENDVPEELRVGVFKQPGFRYGAVVRFSNARNLDDKKPGAHGMSIKLFGVEGEKLMPDASESNTQDFFVFDNPVFFIRDAFDYVDFERAELWATDKSTGETSKPWLAVSFPRPISLYILTRQIQTKPAINPLGARYWSMVPYRLGRHIVKYRAVPEHQGVAIVGPSENSNNEALMSSLKSPPAGGLRFFFQVQLQTDPDLMPIEDATVDWGQQDKDFVTLATIEIHPEASLKRFGDQSVGLNWPPSSSGDDATKDPKTTRSEHLSFSPWHGLIQHEPVGGINRVRRRVYEELSALRHQHNNQVPRVEPEPIEPAPK